MVFVHRTFLKSFCVDTFGFFHDVGSHFGRSCRIIEKSQDTALCVDAVKDGQFTLVMFFILSSSIYRLTLSASSMAYNYCIQGLISSRGWVYRDFQ